MINVDARALIVVVVAGSFAFADVVLIKALGIGAPKRATNVPDIPTIAEGGVPK